MPPTSNVGGKNGRGGGNDERREPLSRAANSAPTASAYKEYAYSPVPASPLSSSVYLPTTLPKGHEDDELPVSYRPGKRTNFKIIEMEESGSKLLQYVAATAGTFRFTVFPPFFTGAVLCPALVVSCK